MADKYSYEYLTRRAARAHADGQRFAGAPLEMIFARAGTITITVRQRQKSFIWWVFN